MKGLLAKPIVDLAIDLTADQEPTPVRERLESTGWIYRGDAGARGGHLVVLESAPLHRVAHAHVVEHLGEQWLSAVALDSVTAGLGDSSISVVLEGHGPDASAVIAAVILANGVLQQGAAPPGDPSDGETR